MHLLLLALVECIIIVHPVPVCRISEFPCRNNKCIRLDRYCDKVNDCGDKSDEPPFCTACNRTFYGEVGTTYDLELPKPRSERLPFLCHLTFTANGHNYGDFVQLLFDAFHVGKLEKDSFDACPDGYMQIMELGRPFTGGSWCGTSSGLAVYYSETSTITATVKLLHFRGNTSFQFRLRYRFLKDDEAVVRFGSISEPLERGEPVPGTYCSRIFHGCSKKRCRLQSPNFPGMYPRNVSCHLSLRQKEIPLCKHAMISVKQENSYKIQIKRSVAMASMNKTRELRTWNECSESKDHLVFYDGSSTDDPVLVKFCGGDWLPRVMSRGPEMLVVFRSTPFSIPLQTPMKNNYPFRGFELDVDVLFVDSDSFDFTPESRKCKFWVNASNPEGDKLALQSKGRSGYLLSPRHTLPPNTTCTWHFKGMPGDLVWVYFVSYVHETLIPVEISHDTGPTAEKKPKTPGASNKILAGSSDNCTTRLRIWDGDGKASHAPVMGEYCDFETPKLCDHSSLSNLTRTTRPCTMRESYLTTGSDLTLQLFSEKGTALHPIFFRLWYEFVDTRLGGEQWSGKQTDEFGDSPCLRVFRRKKRGTVRSPRNVFFYGKGGAKNLSCIYRIEGSPSERVKLTIFNTSFGDNLCSTERDPHTQRPRCVREPDSARVVELTVLEAPYRDVNVPHSCFCDNSINERPYSFISSSRSIEIRFVISKFNASEGYMSLYFNAKFEMIKSAECERRQKVGGSGGEIAFSHPPASSAEANCRGLPWLVEGYQNMSLFLLTWGTFMDVEPTQEEPVKCPTKNRVLIYSVRPTRLLRIVCPQAPNSRHYAIHIFSEEWFTGPSIPSATRNGPVFHLEPPQPPSFLVEFLGFERGIAQINWLEISRTRRSYLQQLHLDHVIPSDPTTRNDSLPLLPWDCHHKCPELNACISESLWCDGRPNCPSGYDESETHCGVGHKFISLIPGGIYAVFGASAAALTFFCLSLALVLSFKLRKANKNKADKLCGDSYRNGPPSRVLTDDFLLDPDSTLSS